jgi:hypothetical protein
MFGSQSIKGELPEVQNYTLTRGNRERRPSIAATTTKRRRR